MPIYAYRCSDCGFERDYLQKMSDPLLRDCPKCGNATLTKQLTAAGFQLKGSGWYATDFKNGAKPAADSSSEKTEAESESAKPESGKSDSAKSGSTESVADKGDADKSGSVKTATTKAAKSEPSKNSEAKPATLPTGPAASR